MLGRLMPPDIQCPYPMPDRYGGREHLDAIVSHRAVTLHSRARRTIHVN
jgi:hypothetical protein